MQRISTLLLVLLTTVSSVISQEITTTKTFDLPGPSQNQKNEFFVYDGQMYFAASRFGGEGKLYRYHGTSWIEISPTNSSIISGSVRDIAQHDGTLYFATDKGIATLATNEQWGSISSDNGGLPSNDVLGVYVDDEIMIVLDGLGISYKTVSASQWETVRYNNLGVGRTFAFNIISLGFSNNTIVWAPGRGSNLITYNIAKKSSKTIGDMGRFLAKDDKYLYGLNTRNTLQVVEDTTFNPESKGICNITDLGEFSTSVIHNRLFTDKNNKVWQIHMPIVGDRYLSTITNGERKTIPITLPIDLKATIGTHYLSYDPVTDSIYSFLDAVRFSLNDFRKQLDQSYNGVEELCINEIATPITNRGILHWDPKYNSKRMEAPRGSCKSPVYGAGLWIGGLDDNGELHTSAMTYAQRGFDFFPGPLKTDGTYEAADTVHYDRMWNIFKKDIDAHIAIFEREGLVLEHQTSEAIWNWPGNGRQGYANYMAPFFDQNLNGTYEPAMGDYPIIPGDQCIYWIMNDIAYPHTETNGKAFGIEIHAMAYAYNCDQLDKTDNEYGVNRSTFYKYKIINKSDSNYNKVVLGTYIDPDLGNYNDDYVGSHVTQNMGYAYNGDTTDEGLKGYGLNPPMVSTVILDAPVFIHDNVDGDGDGEVDEEDEKRLMGGFAYYGNDFTDYGNPSSSQHYYNYLTSRWKNGDKFKMDTASGRLGSDSTDYLFFGNSHPDYPGVKWTEKRALNFPSDRRYLMRTYQFDLNSKDTVDYEYAMVFSRNKDQYDQLPKNLDYVISIKNWYYGDGRPRCGITNVKKDPLAPGKLKISPVPASSSISLSSDFQIWEVNVYNTMGQLLIHTKPNRSGESELDISQLKNGVYFITIKTPAGKQSGKFLKVGL